MQPKRLKSVAVDEYDWDCSYKCITKINVHVPNILFTLLNE